MAVVVVNHGSTGASPAAAGLYVRVPLNAFSQLVAISCFPSNPCFRCEDVHFATRSSNAKTAENR